MEVNLFDAEKHTVQNPYYTYVVRLDTSVNTNVILEI